MDVNTSNKYLLMRLGKQRDYLKHLWNLFMSKFVNMANVLECLFGLYEWSVNQECAIFMEWDRSGSNDLNDKMF